MNVFTNEKGPGGLMGVLNDARMILATIARMKKEGLSSGTFMFRIIENMTRLCHRMPVSKSRRQWEAICAHGAWIPEEALFALIGCGFVPDVATALGVKSKRKNAEELWDAIMLCLRGTGMDEGRHPDKDKVLRDIAVSGYGPVYIFRSMVEVAENGYFPVPAGDFAEALDTAAQIGQLEWPLMVIPDGWLSDEEEMDAFGPSGVFGCCLPDFEREMGKTARVNRPGVMDDEAAYLNHVACGLCLNGDEEPFWEVATGLPMGNDIIPSLTLLPAGDGMWTRVGLAVQSTREVDLVFALSDGHGDREGKATSWATFAVRGPAMKMARAITLAHVGHGGFPRKAADMRKLVLDVAGYDEEFVTLPCRFSGTGEAWRTISPLVDAWGPDDVEDSDLALPVRDGDPALDDMCIPAWMWQEGLPERHRKLYEHRLVLFKTAFLDDEGPVLSNGRLFRAMVAPDIPVLTERDADGNVSTKWAGVLLGPSSYLPGSVPGDHVLFAGPVYETGEGEKGNKGEK